VFLAHFNLHSMLAENAHRDQARLRLRWLWHLHSQCVPLFLLSFTQTPLSTPSSCSVTRTEQSHRDQAGLWRRRLWRLQSDGVLQTCFCVHRNHTYFAARNFLENRLTGTKLAVAKAAVAPAE
jgi:hypothetical protein